MTVAEVIGVYEVAADEPCHLVEILVSDNRGRFDVAEITQPDRERQPSEWQVPYAEKLLTVDGTAVTHDLWDGPGDDALWAGDVRLVFFFHYLDTKKPVRTPFGELRVPSPTRLPERLSFIKYEAP